MNKPEANFAQAMKNYKGKPPGPWWKIEGIESSTNPGIPDLSCCIYTFDPTVQMKHVEFWVELKAQKKVSPVIRKSQNQWLLSNANAGRNCWVFNRTLDDKHIHCFKIHTDIKVEEKGKDHVQILDSPKFTFLTIAELMSQHPIQFR